MPSPIIIAVLLSVSLLFITGCNRADSGDYPDRSVDTTRRVEDIRQNARDQKDAVDARADRIATRHDFDERQIRQKYQAERQAFANSRREEATVRDAQIREIQIQAQHDKEVIGAEVADTLKTSPREDSPEIRANAARRKAEIDHRTSENTSPLRSESERSKATYVQRGLDLDRNESQEISALEQKRSEARNHRNERMLEIDQWTNEALAKVGQDSDRGLDWKTNRDSSDKTTAESRTEN